MILPPSERDDLAERAAAGDRDAAAAALEAVRFLVVRQVGRMHVPARLRDEVTADALAHVFAKLPTYDRRRAAFSTFAANMARWYVLGWRRRTLREPRTVSLARPRESDEDVASLPEIADEAAEGFAEAAADRLDAAALWARLDDLPPRHRAAVVGWANGTMGTVTGAELGISRSRVQQLKVAGLERLRAAAGVAV